TRENGTGKCGLLAVFDEPWYQIGGLEEALAAEICWPSVGFGPGDLLDAQVKTLQTPDAKNPIVRMLSEGLEAATQAALAGYKGGTDAAADAAMPLRESIAVQLNRLAEHHRWDESLVEQVATLGISAATRDWYQSGRLTEPVLA